MATIPIIDTATAAVQTAIDRHRHAPGALLPLLHDVQDALGHVPPSALPLIARALNLSRAEVHGVVTYYHHFRQQPPPRHVLQVCRAESCRTLGAEALLAQARERTAARADWSVEPVYCLGLCASSPAALLVTGAAAQSVHARLTPQSLDALIGTAA